MAGRVLWAIVTALWPAVMALRAEFRMPWWHHGLTWALAIAEAACAVLLRYLQSRARERRHEREAGVRDLRIAQLEARVSAYERALVVADAYAHRRPPGPAPRRLSSVPLQEKRAR